MHGQRAVLLRRSGREDLALREYAEAFRASHHPDQPELRARLLLNRAALHLAEVRLPEARADLDACRALTTNDLIAVKAEHNLGQLDHLAGRLPEALRRYAEAETYYLRHTPGMVAQLRLDRARVLLDAGLYAEADAELARCLPLFRAQGAEQDRAEAVFGRAVAGLLAGDPRAGRRFARAAARLFRRRDNPRWTARSELLEVRAELDLGGAGPAGLPERAAELAGRLRALGLAEDGRVADLLAGRAELRVGDVDGAEARLRPAVARPGDRMDTRLLSHLAAAELAMARGRPRAASRRLVAGLADLTVARGLLGTLDLQIGTSALGRQLAASGLSAAVDRGHPADIFRWGELTRAQALLAHRPVPRPSPEVAAQVSDLRAVELAFRQAEFAGGPSPALRARRAELRRAVSEQARFTAGTGTAEDPVGMTGLRERLGSAAAVVYLQHRRELLALVVTSRRARVLALGPVAAAEAALLRLRADLDAMAGRQMPPRLRAAVLGSARGEATRVGALLLDPLLPLVGDRELVVIPTGSLVTTPWGVVPAARGRPVSVAPSASVWVRARAERPALDRRRQVLLVAGPGIARGQAETLVLAEALTAAGIAAAVLQGAEATPDAAVRRLRSADVAHFAAHGDHQSDNVLFSGLALAGGPLLGYDLQQRLERTPPMVVLSACDLGLHDVRAGGESVGMASALLATGSRTVVASVSRVGDEAAMAVMTSLYAALLSGRPPATALATALVEDAWSGFVCFGAG